MVELSQIREDMDILSYPDNSDFKGDISVSSHEEAQRFFSEKHIEGCYTLAFDLTKIQIKVKTGKTGVFGGSVFVYGKDYGNALGKDFTLERLGILLKQEEGIPHKLFDLFDNAEEITQDAWRKWKDRANTEVFNGKQVVVLKGYQMYWTSKFL